MSRDRVVYSTGKGRVCPHCGLPQSRCVCRKNPRPGGSRASGAPVGGGVRVRRETQGRRGKTVTTISGVPLAPDELKQLAAELKRRCGTGGSARDGVIEIQGDHRDTLVADLEERGYTVQRVGG